MGNTLEGIVLSRLEYGDTALIVDFYSRELGRTTFSAYSSKKKNARFYFAPLNFLEVELYQSKKEKYLKVKEISSLLPEQLMNRDSEIHAIRYFIAEFLKKTLNNEESDEALFSFLIEQLNELYHTSNKGTYILTFLENLSPYLGIDIVELKNNKGMASEFGFTFNESEWERLLAINPKDKKSYLNLLIRFYAHQFEGVGALKSKTILAEIFS